MASWPYREVEMDQDQYERRRGVYEKEMRSQKAVVDDGGWRSVVVKWPWMLRCQSSVAEG